jgi:carbohydrate diacid regulator
LRLTQAIADGIHDKVGALVLQPLSIVDPEGVVLATNNPRVDENLVVEEVPWAIDLHYGHEVVGYVMLAREAPNFEEIAPLIRSIAELMMHQSLLLEQLPYQEERLDKFMYDLLASNQPLDEPQLAAEARLFDIDISQPRIAIVLYIEDPVLTGEEVNDGDDREVRITRYKFGINRGLNSYYTSSTNNIISYLGHNIFCILKDLNGGDTVLEDSLDRFKKSIPTIYTIFRSELKQPTTVGVGNYHPGVTGLRQSYQEALSAIELGTQNWDSNRVYHIDDFGVVAPLLSGIDENNIYFSRELLEKLGENEGIIQTLEEFFSNNMGLTQTADQLGIHRNTLVYRLDRIAETLGLDPRNFDDAVQIKLAILFNKFVEQE